MGTKARKKKACLQQKKHLFSIIYMALLGTAAVYVERCHATPFDAKKLGPSGEAGKGLHVGSSHPGLVAERLDFREQRCASHRVQMGADLIEQEHRRSAVAMLADEVGLGA